MAKERIRKSRRVSRMLKQRHDMGEAKFHEMMKHYVIRKCKNKHPVNWERVSLGYLNRAVTLKAIKEDNHKIKSVCLTNIIELNESEYNDWVA